MQQMLLQFGGKVLQQPWWTPITVGVLAGQGWHVTSEVIGVAGGTAGLCMILLAFGIGMYMSHTMASHASGELPPLTWLWMASCLHGGLALLQFVRHSVHRTPESLVFNHLLSFLLVGAAAPMVGQWFLLQLDTSRRNAIGTIHLAVPFHLAFMLSEALNAAYLQRVAQVFLFVAGLGGIIIEGKMTEMDAYEHQVRRVPTRDFFEQRSVSAPESAPVPASTDFGEKIYNCQTLMAWRAQYGHLLNDNEKLIELASRDGVLATRSRSRSKMGSSGDDLDECSPDEDMRASPVKGGSYGEDEMSSERKVDVLLQIAQSEANTKYEAELKAKREMEREAAQRELEREAERKALREEALREEARKREQEKREQEKREQEKREQEKREQEWKAQVEADIKAKLEIDVREDTRKVVQEKKYDENSVNLGAKADVAVVATPQVAASLPDFLKSMCEANDLENSDSEKKVMRGPPPMESPILEPEVVRVLTENAKWNFSASAEEFVPNDVSRLEPPVSQVPVNGSDGSQRSEGETKMNASACEFVPFSKASLLKATDRDTGSAELAAHQYSMESFSYDMMHNMNYAPLPPMDMHYRGTASDAFREGVEDKWRSDAMMWPGAYPAPPYPEEPYGFGAHMRPGLGWTPPPPAHPGIGKRGKEMISQPPPPAGSPKVAGRGTKTTERCWEYQDPKGRRQGKFSIDEMFRWFDAGYFGPELMIRCSENMPFTPLSKLYPPGSVPFIDAPY